MEKSCAIVIPIFNEEKIIAETVDAVRRAISGVRGWEFEIICVNDGSSDNSAQVLAGLSGVTVLTHPINRGYGAALRTGLNHSSHAWAFICDADSTYPIDDLPKLLVELENGYDMVVGARKGIGISERPFHRIARWILRKMAHVLSGTLVPDLNSGMRVFRKQLFQEFKGLLPMGFSFTTTITMASLYSGYKIKFVPIEYSTRIGNSSIRPVRDFFAFVMLIIRVATYFEPLRFFLPISFAVIVLGILKGLRDFLVIDHIGGFAITVFLMGVQIFMTGILAEVVVRKGATK